MMTFTDKVANDKTPEEKRRKIINLKKCLMDNEVISLSSRVRLG